MSNIKKNYKELLIDVIKAISDIEFQERIWVRGEGPEVSSFDEEMNFFFDTLEIIDFSKKQEYGFSEEQVNSIYLIRDALDNYCDTLPLVTNDRKIFKDPMWKKIVQLASEVYDKLKNKAA